MKLAAGWMLAPLFLAGCAAPATDAAREADDPKAVEIAALEDQRTLGPAGELAAHLADGDAAVRARAAVAVGRLKFPIGGSEATVKLAGLLEDPDARVRETAAFALGMREDPAPCARLIARAAGQERDESAAVRARCIEAASKLDPALHAAAYAAALDDTDANVRLEAAQGMARWKTDAATNTRLAAFVAAERDLRARTYGLFALERLKAPEGRGVFLTSASASDAEERLFAVRGLAALASSDEQVDAALVAASRDADWRIAVEALRGLAKVKDRAGLEAIAAAEDHASHHVRAAAIEAATSRGAAFNATILAEVQARNAFQRHVADPSPAVRAAAVANPAACNALMLESSLANDVSPHVRAAAVRAQSERPRAAHPEMLASARAGGRPPELDLLVRGAEIEALGKLPPERAIPELVARLADQDNGLRLAAVTVLLEQEKPAVGLAPLEACFRSATGEIAAELRFNLLKLAAKAGGDATALLDLGAADEDAYVRRVAREERRKLTGVEVPPVDVALPAAELARPGQGLLANPRPRVLVATSRGELEFVLFGDEAPQHVHNFLAHAEFYAGTTFHRVVSDFVVQGGDARGDGNGGASWRGDALRHEITPRKYVRGSLGMPRNEDWDSGGSQIFVTHRATPHLDGRYTIFGELVQGFEVLDALDLGDRILEVRVLD